MSSIRPQIAVVMPVHNRVSVVDRAITSVFNQDFPDFELIVVDDHSTDGTAACVMHFTEPRLDLIRLSETVGPSAARNRGILAARAPLISFLDSDDVFLPHKLSTVLSAFEKRPDLALLVDSFSWNRSATRTIERRNPVIRSNEAFLRALFTRQLFKATPAITVRREAALKAGLFDEGLRRREDFDFILRVAAIGNCASIDQHLWCKVETSDSLSRNTSTFLDATIALCSRHPEYIAVRRYRSGLAKDVTRHLWRLLRGAEWSLLLRDVRRAAATFGVPLVVWLIASGAWNVLSDFL